MGLTTEQQLVIDTARLGKNILVDACIGSGKTTTIQALCNELPDKHILYLTYNKILKIDAKHKIRNSNVFVQNYHGYASYCLMKSGIRSAVTDVIQTFIKYAPSIMHFDMLIIDEYQDINEEISNLLKIINNQNPNIQIVAVGDYCQKIYDTTSIDVREFIDEFLGDYEQLYFTQCFRLNSALAENLGFVWNKDIIGVNPDCEVSEMDINDIVKFLSTQNPEDVLCLGARTGIMSWVLNELETKYKNKYNKHTTYATIRDSASLYQTENIDHCAIFTTFDGSKGLERPVCVVFDFTEPYWFKRNGHFDSRYEILRNVFCVAASRGKNKIIFATEKSRNKLDFNTLATPTKNTADIPSAFNMSEMFAFKFKEDVENCMKYIRYKTINKSSTNIDVVSMDGYINLSPCIELFQDVSFFKKYNLEESFDFENSFITNQKKLTKFNKFNTIEKNILTLTALVTKQRRYEQQVMIPFITDEKANEIHNRLKERFDGNEDVQIPCEKTVGTIKFKGCADVVKNGVVYELKFKDELSHEDYLQCACYIASLGYSKGILWNIKNDNAVEIRIPDTSTFWNSVVKCVLKRFKNS